jgi:hypothetical protein
MHFDFWTDRKRFQIRRVATELEQQGQTIPDDFTFPDVPLTPSSLATAFKDITILSFNGDPKAGFRFWEGRRRQDRYLGSIYNKAPEPYQAWLFPPLGVDNEAWGRAGHWYGPYSAWHEIDRWFFAYPLKDMAVRGTETIGGKKTYLLTYAKVHDDLRSSLPPNLLEKYKGRARRFERTTAWIDPSQGFLPLKIEGEG